MTGTLTWPRWHGEMIPSQDSARPRRRAPKKAGAVLLASAAGLGSIIGLAPPALATSADVFARGAELRGTTYDGHPTWSGFGPAIDVNFTSGGDTDCGAPLHAPTAGSTTEIASTTGSTLR